MDENNSAHAHLGTRIREFRTWRDKSLRAVAGLAGISPGYLSMIENGERQVVTRATLEGIARALRVSPAELGAPPRTGVVDPDVGEALSHLADVDVALAEVALGEQTVQPRPWGAVAADLDQLCTVLRPRGEIAAAMKLEPPLLRELNAIYATDAEHRRPALRGLIMALRAAGYDAKYLGSPSVPLVAVMHMMRAAEELNEPAWLGLARLCRAQLLGPGSRARSRELSMAAADQLGPHMDDEAVQQVVGMLHLNSGLASATLGDADRAAEHVHEARRLAEIAARAVHPRPELGFAGQSFSPTNVEFWEMAIATEQRDQGKVIELAEQVQPEQVPNWERQSAYHVDLGRALASTKGRREDAVVALIRAEELAPVKVRTNVWVRETVTDLMRWVTRDGVPRRELRGLAYRIGLAA